MITASQSACCVHTISLLALLSFFVSVIFLAMIKSCF